MVADGSDVAVFSILKTHLADAPFLMWYTVDAGKIRAIRAYFDARPFAGASALR